MDFEERLAAIEKHLGLNKPPALFTYEAINNSGDEIKVELYKYHGAIMSRLAGTSGEDEVSITGGIADENVSDSEMKWILWGYLDKLASEGII